MSDQSQANVTVSWLDGRETKTADIVIYSTGLELDEVVDALHTGLAATEGRKYELVSAEISEIVVRSAQASMLAKRQVTRPVRRRLNDSLPVPPAKTGEISDAESVPARSAQLPEGDRRGGK